MLGLQLLTANLNPPYGKHGKYVYPIEVENHMHQTKPPDSRKEKTQLRPNRLGNKIEAWTDGAIPKNYLTEMTQVYKLHLHYWDTKQFIKP